MKYTFAISILLLLAFPAPASVIQGTTVPDVELPTLAGGDTMRLADLRGKIVYIDFWASWCPPCRKSLPALERLRETYQENFEVFAINVDENPEDGRRFLEKHPVSYPAFL